MCASVPSSYSTIETLTRNVQTLKQRLAAMSDDPRANLFKYRAAPLRSGKSPSEMYLGRQIRTKLNALKSSIFKGT